MSDEGELYQFQNAEQVDQCKEVISYRHPTNFQEWVDDFTLKLTGEVHPQTRTFLRGLKAKRIN